MRKQKPIYTGVIKYFPKAINEVAYVSYIGNEQHNPNQPLHWNREKSKDHLDAMLRHLADHASGEKFDSDGVRHLAKCAWRILAELEIDLESDIIK